MKKPLLIDFLRDERIPAALLIAVRDCVKILNLMKNRRQTRYVYEYFLFDKQQFVISSILTFS